MRLVDLAGALVVALVVFAGNAGADVGWTEQQYEQAYGQGVRGYARANERAYEVGQNRLDVEFAPDNSASIGELWVLATVRDDVPSAVLRAGETAERGKAVEEVHFKARSALTAEIREATVNGEVVRVDVRNNLVTRIAFCGKPPTCSLWRRIFGPTCEETVTCPTLDRALAADRTVDALHVRMEEAASRVEH